jgi:hypothetical protein|tara:strand:- start:24 stop:914 length:891 start_codon:yes stop_codon:yes gene_type:complete
MALSTFSELKTEIANYVDRSDLTDQIPTFIKLAEARINRLLRVRIMETVKIISLISGVKRYPLPSDYLQLRTIQYDASTIATTTLNGDITDSATSIVLTSATGFTATGTILIESEQITYTGISTNTLTGCTREVNGTTKAAHTDGTSVSEIYTTFTTGSISTNVDKRISPLNYVTPQLLPRINAGSITGIPEAYTMRAGYLLMGPVPSSSYTMEIDYYARVAALSDSATTNDMLTNNPDLYLYGSLLEAEPFLMNDARVQLWANAFRQSMTDLQDQDDKDSHSGNSMRVMNTGGYY